MQDLFSVIVLCYRHFEFLYEAIDSVLSQDYPRIELIISDDGSKNFPRDKVLGYIESHKRDNIVDVMVRQEPENCGTVKHLNHAVKSCTGEFVIALAGDDVLAGQSVLSRYQDGFANAGADCCIEMAQTGMYDATLKTLEHYYVQPEIREAIECTTESSDQLLRCLLQYGSCLPSTSTCFKKDFFSRFGEFDEGYQLIEDYPMHIRLAKEGWTIHYENFLAIKHRHGGISHGQNGALARSSIAYCTDTKKCIEEVILKSIDGLPPEKAKQVKASRMEELYLIDHYLAKLNCDHEKQELFSVIVLCYRHFEFLYEAIDSVLSQDYPKIELIVSDDGSEDFPREELLDYIEEHKEENIVQVTIRQEAENCGTVKHLNHAVKSCTGEFVIALAGDDVLAGQSVLSSYWDGFMKANADCCIEMAQTAMYDAELRTLESYYLKGSTKKAIEHTVEGTDELLKQLLRYGPCLPSTSTCFKKEFFSRFGEFDESYQLIEDYPMHIRLAKEGWVIHYENFVAIKHRHGGISHGQDGALVRSSIAYYEDMKKMVNELILRNMDELPPEQAKQVMEHRKKELQWLDYQLAQLNHDYWGILKIILKNPFLAMRMGLEQMYPLANRFKKLPLLLSVILWLGAADIDDVFGQVMLLWGKAPASNVQAALCVVAIGIFLLWLVMFAIWAACKIIWRLERFPVESLAIG